MKYLLSQFFLLFLSVILLYYLSTLTSFLPLSENDSVNWYNVCITLLLLFLITQAFISLVIYLIQKFLAFGWREFPNYSFSLRWGLITGLALIIGILLNIFNLLLFPFGSILTFIVLLLINII